MTRIHTHYDNLKVARDAPIEVISAAYRTLSKKYHPDNNPGNADAARIMTIINAAYEVLSDPDKRKEHDQWIAERELHKGTEDDSYSDKEPTNHGSDLEPETVYQERPKAYDDNLGFSFGKHLAANWRIYLFSAIVLMGILLGYVSKEHSLASRSAQPGINSSSRPAADFSLPVNTAPSSEPMIAGDLRSTGYVKGYPMKAMNGHSTVTVDNTQNDRDVLVKLFSLGTSRPTQVRYFIVLAHERFTAMKVTAGYYDIRYKIQGADRKARTDPFNLKEIVRKDGVRASQITFTLNKVGDGNMKTYKISDGDFE